MVHPTWDGYVTAGVEFDAKNSELDFEQLLRRFGTMTDAEATRFGREFGNRLGPKMRQGLRPHWEGMADDLRSVLNETIRGAHGAENLISFDLRRAEQSGRRAGTSAGRGFLSGFLRLLRGGGRGAGGAGGLGGGGGLLSLLTGPTGAFFNVGGGSPISLILVPILGTIVALVAALVQEVAALVSLLYLVPSLLLAIGLQGLTLYLIFNNLSTVIGAVFNAKNPQEMAKALKGVNEQLATFAKSLLPWRDFFRSMQKIAEGNFFGQIATSATDILANVRAPLTNFINQVSTALGKAAADLLSAFSDPRFATAISSLTDSVTRWLTGGNGGIGIGQALAQFLTGLNTFSTAMQPFIDWFGQKFNSFFANLGDTFDRLSKDPAFRIWMKDSQYILTDFQGLLSSVWHLIENIVDAFNRADKEIEAQTGKSFIQFLADQFQTLADLFSGDFGKNAMKGLIFMLELMVSIAVVLVAVLGAALWLIGKVWQFVVDTIALIKNIWGHLFGGASDFNTGGWQNMAGVYDLIDKIVEALNSAGGAIEDALGRLWDGISGTFTSKFHDLFETVRNNIRNFISDPLTFLEGVGRDLMQGLLNGMMEIAEGPIGKQLIGWANNLKSVFDPSAVTRATNGGTGNGSASGGTGGGFGIIHHLTENLSAQTEGMARGNVATNNARITMAPGAVQLNYYGNESNARRRMGDMAVAAGTLLDEMQATRVMARTI